MCQTYTEMIGNRINFSIDMHTTISGVSGGKIH